MPWPTRDDPLDPISIIQSFSDYEIINELLRRSQIRIKEAGFLKSNQIDCWAQVQQLMFKARDLKIGE